MEVNTLYVIFTTALIFGVLIFGFTHPRQTLKQEALKSRIFKEGVKGSRVKITSFYFLGLFKSVIIIGLTRTEKKYYINNYFKRKYKMLWIITK